MTYINIFSYNYVTEMSSFYKSFNKLNVPDIELEKLSKLKNDSQEVNYIYEGNFSNYSRGNRYIKTMNKLKTNPKKYDLTNSTEMLLMLMFCVDPNLEAIKIYNEFNKTDEIRFAMKKYFGVYDPNLIRIEKWYINNLLDKESKTEIEEEIQKRIYKI